MKFDLDKAKAFLSEWDAIGPDGTRANREEVARSWDYNRSHAYDVAARCRRILAQAKQQNGPQPSR